MHEKRIGKGTPRRLNHNKPLFIRKQTVRLRENETHHVPRPPPLPTVLARLLSLYSFIRCSFNIDIIDGDCDRDNFISLQIDQKGCYVRPPPTKTYAFYLRACWSMPHRRRVSKERRKAIGIVEYITI